MLLYLAAPLFNEAELAFNELLTAKIEKLGFKVFLPQRDGDIINHEPYISMESGERAKAIFELDKSNLIESDIFLYVLDGRIPDEGAAVALGIAYTHKELSKKNRMLIGLHTDKRAAFINVKLNPMIFSPLEHISESVDELLLYLETVI